MQIARLFEIVYLLMEQKSMSAKALAERFEVSPRTIRRDVDTLSQAGIPIYTVRGQGGGIRLMDEFVLNKMVLSREERKSVADALQGLRALRADGAALGKLSALFGTGPDWIEIDFSGWDSESPMGARFSLLKEAVLAGRTVTFRYSGVSGRTENRTVEPAKLIFRGGGWYLLAWCRMRQDYRYFKLSRMADVEKGEPFSRAKLPPIPKQERQPGDAVEVVALADESVGFRIRDEFGPPQREEREDGGYLVRFRAVENEWLYEYLLTFGPGLEVLSPAPVRRELARRLAAAAARYAPESP